MELGERLRKARLDAGLSQRELCGGVITRNMLSQIENGSARPSMKTMTYFAQRLGKPVSWFLEEAAVTSPNIPVIQEARRHFDAGNWTAAVECLKDFSAPDEVFQRERDLIWAWSCLELAEQALVRGQAPYAAQLLAQTQIPLSYCARELDRRRLLLSGRLGQKVSGDLPSLDEELLLRGKEALLEGDVQRCARLLEAAQDRESPQWNLVRGEAWFAQGAYEEAALCLARAEAAFPGETVPKLEQCYKELGDYQKAYAYACKGRRGYPASS